MTQIDQVVEYRRALEALRNGVPNSDAVRVLGCGQAAVEEAFERQLADVAVRLEQDDQAPGMLVAGGFGTGKSHLLEYLQHRALSSNFVCSKIVISKETPLHDQAKVFRAAVESAMIPGKVGEAVHELAASLKPDSSTYAEFDRWIKDPDNGIEQLFPATLTLHERLGSDPDLVDAVRNFWAGEPLPIADVRRGLKQCNAATAFSVKAVKARDLPHQRFTFLSRLIRGAGYAGWVLLFDEVELVGRYSLLQRGKSYAELARWLGKAEGSAYPGLTAVAAITDDFGIEVLQEKEDLEKVGARLREKGTDEMTLLAARAETGMRAIQRDAIKLATPDEQSLRRTYERVREVHAGAYRWSPPDLEGSSIAIHKAMRSYVRRWINEWDLTRLFPDARVDTIEEDLRPTYGEDEDLERESETSADASEA